MSYIVNHNKPQTLKKPRKWRVWKYIDIWARHDGHIADSGRGGYAGCIIRCNRCNKFLNAKKFCEAPSYPDRAYICYFCGKHGNED